MLTVKEVQNIINQSFNNINWNVEPNGLYAPIDYILALSGKKVRPTLTLLAANLFSENINSVINASVGLEIFHNFTLLHDDIMDKAPVRRGHPTVHKKWDENTAILSGDAMMIKAYQYMAQVPEKYLPECLAIFSQTAIEVCEGQQYDVDFESRNSVSEEEYLEMIRLKTAVLLGAALQIGAIIAGADAVDAKFLYDFGINIGLAFQLKDDFLDVYGNTETFGKQIGGDILCNKKTYLLINALNRADKEQKDALLLWINTDGTQNPTEKIAAVTNLYNQIGIKTVSEEKMQSYFIQAMQCLDKVTIAEEKKQTLREFTTDLMNRLN
jgi:geranylgeranyl diphosphate synthase type II